MSLQDTLAADQTALATAAANLTAATVAQTDAQAKVDADNAAIAAAAQHLSILDNIEAELSNFAQNLTADIAGAFDPLKTSIGGMLNQARALLT